MVSSAPTILRLWVWIPSTASMLFSSCINVIVMRKGRKWTKRGRDWPIFKNKKTLGIFYRFDQSWRSVEQVWVNFANCTRFQILNSGQSQPLLMGQPHASFCLFSSFQTQILRKNVCFSTIQTWIVEVEGEHTDHLTSTTPRPNLFSFHTFIYKQSIGDDELPTYLCAV